MLCVSCRNQNPQIMSYKVKSLLYFSAFMASVLLYASIDTDEVQETAGQPEIVSTSVTLNGDVDAGEDTAFLEDNHLKE